jgi:hypothetical protein
MSDESATSVPATFVPPHPGSPQMPRWDAGVLPAPPRFTARSWAMLLGPGIVMGGSAIGGGEWITGPLTTAKYGGAILWLSTVSIIAQVFYNLEISRYTLYCGESIFPGKFRLLPGPKFWLITYILLDFGSVFPYVAANTATPLASVIVGEIPKLDKTYELLGVDMTGKTLRLGLQYVCFLLIMLPMIFGGKAYRSVKAVMNVKIVVVLGFLFFVAICYSTADTWREIITGFFRFGAVPVKPTTPGAAPGMDNIFFSLWEGRGLPNFDFTMIAMLGALAAISGNGGLTNTTTSAYTRDQGWGMGQKVGAVPSIIGGRKITLSHTGMVFPITRESIARFRGWYNVVLRDQLIVWMPACFVGVALPSMLSVQFLPRNTEANEWDAAGMTADGLAKAVGPEWGSWFWHMSLFCGFLVLAPSAMNTVDGVVRRWVDVCWTAVPAIRRWETHRIRYLYFGALCAYGAFGLTSMTLWAPGDLIKWAGIIYNYALGFSCFHVLGVNLILLPRQLRPGWLTRCALVVGGIFFLVLAVISTRQQIIQMGQTPCEYTQGETAIRVRDSVKFDDVAYEMPGGAADFLSTDWKIPAESLGTLTPQAGDRIQATIGGETRLFEVVAIDSARPAAQLDRATQLWLIHSKRVPDEEKAEAGGPQR